MEFLKKRNTAWAVLAIVIVISFFIGQSKKPSDRVEILESGVYVQDNANVLSDETESFITKLNNDLVSKVGGEIQVATIDTTNGKDAFDIAWDLGVNTNLSENSCVFVIAVNDTDAVIVQGDGLIYAFTDEELSEVLNSSFTVKDFENRNIDEPARIAFNKLINMYEEYYDVNIVGSENVTVITNSSSNISEGTLVIVILLLVILILMNIMTRPYYPYRRRRTIFTPSGYRPNSYYGHTHTSSTTRSYNSSSRTGGFGSSHSSRGGSFGGSFGSSSSRSGGFRSSSRSSSSRGGSFGSSSSRSGGFSSGSRGSSRGGSFGGGSRGGGFRK